MTSASAIAVLLIAACTLVVGGAAFAAGASQDGARKPSSLVPAPRTDEWAIAREKECIRRAKESQPAKVVFVGDSITQAWEDPGKAAWEKHIAPLGAVNLGNSGDRTENVLYRLEQAPLARLEAEHVFLLIGTNNLGHGTSNAAETLAGVQAVAETLATQCPKATIHIIEIFPRGEAFNAMRGDILQINQALRAWVAQKGSRFAIHAIGDAFTSPDGTISKDLMPDFLHLTPKAYEMWATAVAGVVGKSAAGK
jgi:lysophospholipase L1-like esterase